jgi:hypothetical protein
MIYLNHYFFDFVSDADYFQQNEDIVNLSDHKLIIGLAFYAFDFEKMIKIITTAKSKSNKLIVYIKEPPFSEQLIDLVKFFEADKNIMFFGDAVLNVNCTNWKPAVSWFVSPRHYYQVDNWAKDLLHKVSNSEIKKPYYFDCLLGTRKNHRDTVEQYYQNSCYKHLFVFNYFKDNINNGNWDRDVSELNLTSESITVNDKHRAALSALVPYYIYNQSYHSIVAESTDFNKYNHVTEKIAKPIIAERIFVVFAGQFYLRSLTQLGFKTFDSIIDESYDLEPDPKKRYKLAWDQAEYLCTQDPIHIRNQVKEILAHNKNHFLNTDWHQPVKECLKNWADTHSFG